MREPADALVLRSFYGVMKSEATKFHISLRSKSLVFWLGILSRHGKSQPKRVELRLAQSSYGRRIFRRSQDVDYEYRFCHSSLCSAQISGPRVWNQRASWLCFVISSSAGLALSLQLGDRMVQLPIDHVATTCRVPLSPAR